MTETSFQFNWESMIFRMVTSKQRFCTQNKTKKTKKVSRKFYFRMAIKFTHSLALTRKVEREGGSFVSQQTQNFFKKDFYPTQRVRQSCPILSANCTRFDIFYVCFVYFAAIAQVWINLHRQHVFYTVML